MILNEFSLFTNWWDLCETSGNSILLKNWANWLHWDHTGAQPWGGVGWGCLLWDTPFHLLYVPLFEPAPPQLLTWLAQLLGACTSGMSHIHGLLGGKKLGRPTCFLRLFHCSQGDVVHHRMPRTHNTKLRLLDEKAFLKWGQRSCFKAHSLISLKTLLLAMGMDGYSARRVAAVGIIQNHFGLRSPLGTGICVQILSMLCDCCVTLG